jgi:hypothetical protein
VPGRWVQVPQHGMLNPQTIEPMSIPCPGTKHWGIGHGRREDWEQNWSTRKPGRPRPKVLDGSPIRVITILNPVGRSLSLGHVAGMATTRAGVCHGERA